MKVVILAGGYGTRLSEETDIRPKPMVQIGEKPILWHIMKIYSHYGFNEFIICLGYKGYMIKEYFANYFLHQTDVTIDLGKNDIKIHSSKSENWKVSLIDTGLETQTGGRIKRIKKYINNETFMLTYGDGVANINIKDLVKFHKKHKKFVTVTAVSPPAKFGALTLGQQKKVISFKEKPEGIGTLINGGFFVLEPEIFDYIQADETIWERTPLENLAKNHQIMAYIYNDFWKCMDNLKDKRVLEELWSTGNAPWKVWSD